MTRIEVSDSRRTKVTQIRRFRNDDVPRLVTLWNRATPAEAVAKPLSPHEFAAAVLSRLDFQQDGLLIAEGPDSTCLGFVHVGHGPLLPEGPSHRLDPTLGTLAMLLVDPSIDDPGLADQLVRAGVDLLRHQGAQVIYAGGHYPLNPFYWGLYAGSEFSGILQKHHAFRLAVEAFGFQPAAETQLFEFDLAAMTDSLPDPRLFLVRRQTRLDFSDERPLHRWWDALALGGSRPIQFSLLSRNGDPLGQLITWDMAGFDRLDGRLRAGLIDVHVDSAHRRRGYGKLLVWEVLRFLQEQEYDTACVQTPTSNAAAMHLYQSLNFQPTQTTTLYRLPGPSA